MHQVGDQTKVILRCTFNQSSRITVYLSGYTETDTTAMLSPPTVWRFSVAAEINSNVFYFYCLIWSLSRLLCCVGSGFIVTVA